jgi:SdrD B-like domain/Secretion system C-terminal sorting domain
MSTILSKYKTTSMKRFITLILCLIVIITTSRSQAFKAFSVISGNPNATGNNVSFFNATAGTVGAAIVTTNGVPAGNNNLPYGVAFDPTEGKLYYSKPGTTAGTSVFNVYNNTGASATHTNLGTISGGEFFRMGVGQDGNVYGTLTATVIQLSASAPRIDIKTVKLTRYNPTANTFTVLGNIQCPAAYASTMPAPYNTGDYWSSSDATTTPFYAAQLGHAGYGDLFIAPNNTLYMSIGKKLITIPNYQTLTGTALIPSVEVGNILPTGVGFNFTTEGPGTYGIAWNYDAQNILVMSSRTSDGRDGSFLLNPTTLALIGVFNQAPAAASNFADFTSMISSIGIAKQLTTVQWLGYNNRYRLTYRVRVENLGQSILKVAQVTENLSTAFPALAISNVSAAFVTNPSSLVLNPSFNGTTTTTLLDGTRTLYGSLYNGINLNGGAGNITAGSNFAEIDITFDVAGVATNGTTTYNNTAVSTGNAFDATLVTDNSDNGTSVETGVPNLKADDAGEGDPTPIRFGSSVSGTVWNDINNSANNTLANIFTAGETGTNASGLNAILVDPVTGFVIASTPVAANGTYTFTNVPSFANLRVLLSTTAGTAGSLPPATGLPTGWSATSPLLTNTTGDINTGTYNASDAVRFGATDDPNNDFGIQRLPESAFNLQPSQVNPSGFGTIPIVVNAFQTNNVGATPNTQDYDGGTVSNIRITAFPSNTNTITINGVIYINGGTCPPAATCTPWPGGGVTIPYTNGVGPNQSIAVDPINGDVSVVIPFVAIDNAGKEDATPGSVTLPLTRPVVVGDRVWKDDDGDGSQDAGEVGVAGVTVTLFDNGGNAVATTITDAYGNYQFNNVYAASGGTSYTVGFTPPANYSFSPQTGGGGAANAVDSDPNPTTGRTASFTVNPGDIENDIDAGLVFAQPTLLASIGDRVWVDTDNNGVQDAGEPGMAGVTVTLFNSVGNVIGSTITDASGNYIFNNLPAGSYQVGFTSPAGFIFSPKDAGGNDNTDSDVNTSGVNFGRTDLFVVAAGEQKTNVDAGLVPNQSTTSVGDRVWNDLDQDGVQDAGEPGIAGVQVQFYTAGIDGIVGNGDDVLQLTTITDASGNYMFTGITPGSYYVKFTPPSGYSISPQDAGGNDNTDSDINSSGNTTKLTVTPLAVVDTRWDAGLFLTASPGTSTLGDKVWNDLDGDGVQDTGEPGMAGIQVILYNSGGTPIDTAYTDVNGNYIFTNLAAANYSVGFKNLPAGFVFTGQDLGGNDNTDSDPNAATGRTGTIVVPTATNVTNVDAGIRQGTPAGTATVGNRVWYDLDNDGSQDVGELGVPNVTVTLREAGLDGIFGNGDDVLRTTTTNTLGDFIFTGLPAGNYRVEYSTLPAGFTTSPQNAGGDDTRDSDGGVPSGGISTTGSFNLAIGDDKLDVALGLVPPANTNTIGDRMWIDTNADGVQDAGETNGLPGVTVTLYNAAGVGIATTTTDANGNYIFVGIADGTYTVGFANLPTGYSLTGKDLGGNDGTDSDADVFSSRTAGVTVGAGNRTVTSVDAGAISTRATLGDRVWSDLDGDGVQDAGEPGIAGVTVTLYDNTNTAVASMITDENGNYLFTNVIPGTYTVGFGTIPAALGFTAKEVAPVGTGSDVNIATGRTDAITLAAGDYRTDVDAGLRPPATATIGDFVWNDVNSDGIQNSTETGVAGVLVTLYSPGIDGIPNNGDDVAIGAAVTDGNGKYLMTNVPAGNNYYLTFINKPSGSVFTTQNVGGGGASDNSKVSLAGLTAPFNVAYGQNITNLDAGILSIALLPVQLLEFTATKIATKSLLKWTVAQEDGLQKYAVERSTDGVNYTVIGYVNASGAAGYNFTDVSPAKGVNQYRLKMIDISGKEALSSIRILRFGANDMLTIYPNPATSVVNISLPEIWQGKKVSVNIINSGGQIVLTKHIGGANQIEVLDIQRLSYGFYTVRLVNEDGEVETRKLQVVK